MEGVELWTYDESLKMFGEIEVGFEGYILFNLL